jgi:inosine-uridine nucleoside N-ribohydrolase
MALPVLIDCNMNVDGAVALCLSLGAEALDVRAVVATGGLVSANQSIDNTRRILAELKPRTWPSIGRGIDAPMPRERRLNYGETGLCDITLRAASDAPPAQDGLDVYREFLATDGERCVIVVGPLSTFAAVMADISVTDRDRLKVCICGGAVWTEGNAGRYVEDNFARDPAAASAACASGLPISVAPLDVTNYIALDASNVAHLAASGYRTGELAARLLEPLIEQDSEPCTGKTHVAGAVAVASVIWPDLFLKTRMRLEIDVEGPNAGRTKPGLGGDKSLHVDLLTAVNAVDLLENMLESLCHEEFVV